MSNHRNLLFDPPAGGEWNLLRNKNLAVAFSGGKDSLALLHYLKINEHLLNARIHAIHINHALRGTESDNDEAFCRRYCEEHGVFFRARVINVKESALLKQRGIEYAARKLRYEILRQERENAGCDYILTAHTMDDRIETFFTDLITGASIFTLGGIEAAGADIVRPFLSVTSQMVTEFLAANKLTPVYDSSNSDSRFVRNQVRSHTLFMQSMKDTVLRIQTESARLNSWLSGRTAKAVLNSGDDFVEIDRALLMRMSQAEQGFLIGSWVSKLCRGGKIHSDTLISSLARGDSVRFSLPMGYLSEISFESVRIFPSNWVKPFEYIKNPGGIILEISCQNRTAEFPLTLRDTRLIVRNRLPGDRFQGKKLKKLFSDIKLPLILRDCAVVITDGDGEILWAEHLPVKDGFDVILREGHK
jgi:tRNA(Ile)-lysidine synthase